MLPKSKFNPSRLSAALAWRFRKLVGDQRVDRAIVHLAHRWRPVLQKPLFIGIAGSAGKTTTKELLHGVLSYRRRGLSNPSSLNALPEVAKVVLRLRPGHDFCIAELSEDKPGIMDAPLTLLRPSIGVVTVVGNDHWSAFGSRDGIAKEVGKLVASLPANGTAVLNADDETVLAMAKDCAARVITYGTSPHASLRAEDVRSVWPDRLQMTLNWGTVRATVRTQLCGTHLLPTVLGAIGGGLAAGLSLTDCVDGIANIGAFDGRMQPVTTADGVSFIRDDFKAPLWTVDACFEFMKTARAKRKIIVIGEVSDIGISKEVAYARVALRAQGIADLTIFVGPWASSALKARQPGMESALLVFSHVRDAADYLKREAREGDLVLLKGTNRQDHLLRIILARDGAVACWRDDCRLDLLCNQCDRLMKPSGAPLLLQLTGSASEVPQPALDSATSCQAGEQVVVGLGNPEPRYIGSPHNFGYEVVDQIATSFGLPWSTRPEAWISRGEVEGQPVCLVKIRMAMNATGAGLKQLSSIMGFDTRQCILVYDDLDLPLGTVRTRPRGSAGGHRGVASILEAFQTNEFRRVRVGVGHAKAKLNRVDYVLTPLDLESRVAADMAIELAHARVIESILRATGSKAAQRMKAPMPCV